MAHYPIDIHWVVQQVLADFAKNNAPVTRGVPETIHGESSDALVVTNRVLSLTDLNGKWDKLRKIVISPTTLLTPAVRDEIIKRKIEIATKLPTAADKKAATAKALYLAILEPASLPLGTLGKLRRLFCLEWANFDNQIGLIDEAEKILSKSDTSVCVITEHTSSLLCRLNRRSTIRAILGVDVNIVVRDAQEIDANVLVVDPKRIPPFRLTEMVTHYANR